MKPKNFYDIAANQKSSYRPEIDGLRAFAVAAVIINHFNEDILPSGYLGVDIFFVISGYVITSSLADRKSTNLSNFIAGFYARRIKRLVPALAAFVVIIGLLCPLILTDATAELNLGLSSLFGVSNIVLYRSNADYFAESINLNPFTHTWSLGVEEQFYLFFPLLIWLSGFAKQKPHGYRNLFLCVGSLSIASLLCFIYLYQTNQAAAYFLMPPRFWEMASGCLIYIIYKKYTGIEQKLSKLPSLFIIVIMIGVMFSPVAGAVLATITIVVLSAILLACLKEGSAGYNLFTYKKVVYTGNISYSLYLWHWGILFLSRWTIGIHWWSAPFQLGLMFLIAMASYKFIETPIRTKSFPNSAVTMAAGLIVTLVSSTLLVLFRQTSVYARGIFNPEHHEIKSEMPNKSCEVAFVKSDNYIQGTELSKECGNSDFPGRPTLYALGDSHSHQYFDAISQHAKSKKYNFVLVWGTGCLFPSAVIRNNEKVCFDRQQLVEKNLLRVLNKNDVVLVAGALNLRFDKNSKDLYYKNSGIRVDSANAARIFSLKFQDLSNKVTQKGAKIILYIDTINFPGVLNGELCRQSWYRPTWAISKNCFYSLDAYKNQVNQYFSWRNNWHNGLNQIVWNSYENALTCNDRICNATRYRDSNHLVPGYAHHHYEVFLNRNPHLFDTPPQ